MDFLEIFDTTWRIVVVRSLLNISMVFIVARFFYYSRGKGNLDYLFTYIAISAIVFIVCILLSQVPVEMGFALGLFAIFSVIRFRSVQATPRELTYLFICLGLAIMNALLKLDVPIIKIVANNLLIILTIGIAEYLLFRNGTQEKIITYDRLDLLAEDKRGELEEDLQHRFGVNHIKQIQVGNIDTIKNRVKLRVIIRDFIPVVLHVVNDLLVLFQIKSQRYLHGTNFIKQIHACINGIYEFSLLPGHPEHEEKEARL